MTDEKPITRLQYLCNLAMQRAGTIRYQLPVDAQNIITIWLTSIERGNFDHPIPDRLTQEEWGLAAAIGHLKNADDNESEWRKKDWINGNAIPVDYLSIANTNMNEAQRLLRMK